MISHELNIFLTENMNVLFLSNKTHKTGLGAPEFNFKTSFQAGDKLLQLAGLHVPKKRFFLAVLLERFFLFADSTEKKDFQIVKLFI